MPTNIGRDRAEIKTITTPPKPAAAGDAPRPAVVAAILLLSLAVFFRAPLASGLTRLFGDGYDGAIEVAILDHWYQVAVHGAAFARTGWFAPYADTIGYNDTYLLPAVPFVLARIAGADPFLAVFAAHVVMRGVGFLGQYALLRRGLGVGMPLSLAGAEIVTTANGALLHMYHGQLLAVGVLPWLALLAILAAREAAAGRRRTLLAAGIGFATLFGAGAVSTLYPFWFFALYTALAVGVGLAIAGRGRSRRLAAIVRRYRRDLLGIALSGTVAMVPLAAIYFPKLHESGGHPFAREVLNHLPIAQTLINVGPGNLVWGHLLPQTGFHGGEQRVGFPPGLLVIAAGAIAWSWRRRRQAPGLAAAGAATVVLLLLAMRWSAQLSAWWLVYRLVPGADAVRVITRLLLFLLIPIVALAMAWLDTWRRRWLAAAVVAFLLVEQVQTAPPVALDRRAFLAMLADVGPPPATCDAFFVVTARRSDAAVRAEADRVLAAWGETDRRALLARYRHNVDAMLIASYYGRPTINGLSTFNPPDWRFESPDRADYRARVAPYVRRHPVGRLCGLDRRRDPAWFAF